MKCSVIFPWFQGDSAHKANCCGVDELCFIQRICSFEEIDFYWLKLYLYTFVSGCFVCWKIRLVSKSVTTEVK